MKKVKIVFWLVILVIIASVFYQNINFLRYKPELYLNILLAKYNTNEVSNAFLFASVFLAGLLISYFACFSEKLKARKKIKKLNEEIAIYIKELSELKAESHKKIDHANTDHVNKEDKETQDNNADV